MASPQEIEQYRQITKDLGYDDDGVEKFVSEQVTEQKATLAQEDPAGGGAKRIRATEAERENEIRLREEAKATKRCKHEAALEQMRTNKLRLEIQLAEVGATAQPVRPEKVEAKLPIQNYQNLMRIKIAWMTICKGLRDL